MLNYHRRRHSLHTVGVVAVVVIVASLVVAVMDLADGGTVDGGTVDVGTDEHRRYHHNSQWFCWVIRNHE